MQINRVCILGGTGFVGRWISARLTDQGIACRILTRHPQRHRELQLLPGCELRQVDIFDPKALTEALRDCQAAINLVGILNQNHAGDFRRIHVELVDTLVDACREADVHRLLHMSALQADASTGSSEYLRSKGEGENRAHTLGHAGSQVTSFRPSVIFGVDDSFFNRFAGLLRMSPGLFPLACPNARFAPVYVGDVAEAYARVLNNPASFGRHYDLCGPRTFSLRELVAYTAKLIDRRSLIMGLGDGASRFQARLLGLLPGKPFSYDNYLSLQTDSLCQKNGFEALGIQPLDVDAVMPFCLGGKDQRQNYGQLRRRS